MKTFLLVGLSLFFLTPPCCSGLVSEPSSSFLGLSIDKNNQRKLLTDLSIATALSFGVDPLVENIFNATHIRHGDLDEVNFKDTFLYGATGSISTAAKTFIGFIVTDLMITKLGYSKNLPFKAALSTAALRVAISVWSALTLSAVKRTIFLQGIVGTRLGRVALFDKLIDFLIAIITVVFVLEILEYDFGLGFQSILAGSGVGAVIFSLASKDLASALVGGFIVQAWDAFSKGETIKLGDGTEGTVKKIGLLETEITGSDNIAIKIPNSQLTNIRVSNLSRIKQSRVYQTLRFSYSDLKRLPMVLNDIKKEIQMSCPKLITDGTRPFQAVLSSYNADHIEAIINCHFNIPVNSGEYALNRQEVLLAISRALEKNGISFALPSIVYRSQADRRPPSFSDSRK